MKINKASVLDEFYIVREGLPEAVIIIDSSASEKVIWAAKDLRDNIRSISGCALNIIKSADPQAGGPGRKILVGYSDAVKSAGFQECIGYPGTEVTVLWRKDETLILYGNDDGLYEGTRYAVTMLLESFGCGWFGPDELWTVIPDKKTLSVGFLQKRIEPRFTSRRNWVLRKDPELGSRWFLGGQEKEIEHAYWKLFPREKYFKDHPEWYCMVDGKRDPYIEWWQMCYSNDELVHETAEKIKGFFRKEPDCTQATLAANDGFFKGFCECENCQKMGTPSEIMAKFASKVAELIESEFPDKKVMIFVYFPTLDPPTGDLNIHRNVTLMFCKESCMCHSVDQGPDCGYHCRYEYEFGHKHYEMNWLENTKQWIERTGCNSIAIWEWNCPAAADPVWKDIPWVQGDLVTRNLRCFEELGAEYVYFDQGPVDNYNDTQLSYPLRWPLWYVSAKSMWDRYETASQILMSACLKLFEEAGDLMYAYYSCLADINSKCYSKAIAWHMPEPEEMYTDDAVKRIDGILSAACAFNGSISEKAAKRIANQTELWAKAREIIINRTGE